MSLKNRNEINVLLVDDEKDILTVFKTLLELESFNAFTANDGDEAVKILAEQRIDFIISDIRMPKRDGISLMHYVKEHYNFIPQIVLVSGYSEVSRDEVMQYGALDLITKPADMEELIKLIIKHTGCN